jgi:hypothetical protein
MAINRAVTLALNMRRELESYSVTKDRAILIKAMRDQFVLTRNNAALEVEKNRLLALDILVTRMAKMSDNMLIRVIEMLSSIGAVDLEAITNGPSPLVTMQQNNLGIALGKDGSNPVRDTGELLECLEHLGTHFRNKMIDLNDKPDK